jgi:hypothetical protein
MVLKVSQGRLCTGIVENNAGSLELRSGVMTDDVVFQRDSGCTGQLGRQGKGRPAPDHTGHTSLCGALLWMLQICH